MNNSKIIERVLRIAVAGEFIGHGVFALQGKKTWIDWIHQLTGAESQRGGNLADASRFAGFACRLNCAGMANSGGCFVGGLLGILDCACASDCRRANLGLH